MIIQQPPAAPDRILPSDLRAPFYWTAPDPLYSETWLEAVTDRYLTIPEQIRTTLEVPWISQTSPQRRQLKIVLGNGPLLIDQFAFGQGRRPGDVVWQGLYQATGKLFANSIAIQSPSPIVHEFGHHIDYTYRALWPGVEYSDNRLTDLPEFINLWNAAYPTIDTGEYGRTNIREWFAELWKAQIDFPSPPTFRSLAGGNMTIAANIRTAFTSRLPMPPFTF